LPCPRLGAIIEGWSSTRARTSDAAPPRTSARTSWCGWTARRVKDLAANPLVSLNFAGDGEGGDIVVLSGRARVGGDAGPVPTGYDDKYRTRMEGLGVTPEQFAARYSEAIVVELTRARGH
jgi:hypothetical protein